MWPFTKKEYIYSDLKLKDALPVGSIVELNDYEGKYMIHSYKGYKRSKNNRKVYYEVDYWCIPWFSSTTTDEIDPIPVMKKDIKKIIFQGYNSIERIEFLNEIDSMQEGVK